VSAPRVVVNADDFGESLETTAAIAACMNLGVVTSTTILANLPGTDAALRWASAACGDRTRSYGVHLNLCEGPALTGASSLTDERGVFTRKRFQSLRAFAGRLDPGDVARELRAQITRVRDGGVEISHLDGHKHLHQLPGVEALVLELARELGVPRVRCTREHGLWPKGATLSAGASRLVRRALASRLAPRLASLGLRSPALTLDLGELLRLATAAQRARRLAAVSRAGEPLELFCHPGASGRRGDESRYLGSPEFAEVVREAGVRLVSYWEI
jgi:predicted glycoside hydrolase/deacetylase ChbG (UPF0249 family)